MLFLSMFFFVRTCQIVFDDQYQRQKTNAVRHVRSNGQTLIGESFAYVFLKILLPLSFSIMCHSLTWVYYEDQLINIDKALHWAPKF